MHRSTVAPNPRRPGRRLLLAIVPLLLALEIPGALDMLRRPDPGWRLRGDVVMVVDPQGPARAAGVRVEDRLIALGPYRIASYADTRAAFARYASGDTLTVTLAREGAVTTAEVHLEPRPLEALVETIAVRLSAAAFLFLGFITYLRRDDEVARTFLITCLLLAFPLIDLPSVPERTWMRLLAGTRDGLQALMAAYLLRFLLIFPEGPAEARRARRQQRWIAAPALALVPLHVASALRAESGWARTLEPILLAVTTLLFAGYVVAGVVVFVRKIRRRDTWVRGSKLRLASLGLAAGLLPLTLAAVARWIAPTHGLPLDELAVLMLPMIPASISLALLRSGAIDLAYLTRQSLVALFLALPLLMIAWLLAGIIAPRIDPALRPVVHLVLGVVAALAVLGARPQARSIARLVDRTLYPEQRRVRRVAESLGREISELHDPEEVVDRVLSGVGELVGTSHALLLERDGHVWLPTASEDETLALPDDTSLARLVVRSREIVLVDRDATDARFGSSSQAWVRRAAAHVVAPLVVSGETTAILVTGARHERRDYGALHLYHLDSLCRQAAAALQNARLHQEDLARERVRMELELAQQIQQQLLPQEPLRTDGITVCGRTVASRSVGGDLHDHFTLSDGRIVVVVGDASGKGIPASLLTSGVRTAVRETIRPGLPLADAMAHLNRHVHGMTDTGHFVALFCAVIDPADGMTEYCVAGIEPPLWVRPGVHRVEPWTRGGPVLGVDPSAAFRVGVVRLDPGDAVVAYSDGVIDEEDADGEPFGAERLGEQLQRAWTEDPVAMLDSIFDAVRAFAAGEAVDDTTVVVVRRAAAGRIGTDRALASA